LSNRTNLVRLSKVLLGEMHPTLNETLEAAMRSN